MYIVLINNTYLTSFESIKKTINNNNLKKKQMKRLFICESEFVAFTALHPEYNHFEEVKDKYEELVGYYVSVINENDNED